MAGAATHRRAEIAARSDVRLLSFVVMAMAICWMLISGFWLFPGELTRVALTLFAFTGGAVAWLVSERSPFGASVVLLSAGWLAVTGSTFSTDAFPSPIVGAYVAIAMIGARLFGVGGAIVSTLASALAIAFASTFPNPLGFDQPHYYSASSVVLVQAIFLIVTLAAFPVARIRGARRERAEGREETLGSDRFRARRVADGLLELSARLDGVAGFESRMGSVCDAVCRALGCDRSTLLLVDGETLRARFEAGGEPHDRGGVGMEPVGLDDPLVRMAADSGSWVVGTRTALSDRRGDTLAVAPILGPEARVEGFLTAELAASRADELSDQDGKLLLALARLARPRTALPPESPPAPEAVAQPAPELADGLDPLATEVARDVHNLLTRVAATCDLALLESPSAREADRLESIAEAAVDAGGLTETLLDLALARAADPMGAVPPAVGDPGAEAAQEPALSLEGARP